MKEFLFSALPFVLEGSALAILAANYQVGKQKDEHFKQHSAMGAGFGLLLGVALNSCGCGKSTFSESFLDCCGAWQSVQLRGTVIQKVPTIMNENCPCKKKKCPRHGDCVACREHHATSKYNRPVRCEKKRLMRILQRKETNEDRNST